MIYGLNGMTWRANLDLCLPYADSVQYLFHPCDRAELPGWECGFIIVGTRGLLRRRLLYVSAVVPEDVSRFLFMSARGCSDFCDIKFGPIAPCLEVAERF